MDFVGALLGSMADALIVVLVGEVVEAPRARGRQDLHCGCQEGRRSRTRTGFECGKMEK